jgi:hypothetical protein
MPTGYTDYIKDGITFQQFALRCARAFGACVEMRDSDMDEPIPDEFKPSDYHTNALKEANKNLAKYKSMTIEKATAESKIAYARELNERNIHMEENNKQIKLYEDMLVKVKKWIPPTPEHVELKEFMIKQIEGSIEFDGMGDYYKNNPVIKLTPEEWIRQGMKEVLEDIEYHTEELEKEIQRTNSRNNWIRNLRDSLK